MDLFQYRKSRTDVNKVKKLNKLYIASTFWNDVEKLTKNVKNKKSLERWRLLADIRYQEINILVDAYYYIVNATTHKRDLVYQTTTFTSTLADTEGIFDRLALAQLQKDNKQKFKVLEIVKNSKTKDIINMRESSKTYNRNSKYDLTKALKNSFITLDDLERFTSD